MTWVVCRVTGSSDSRGTWRSFTVFALTTSGGWFFGGGAMVLPTFAFSIITERGARPARVGLAGRSCSWILIDD